MEKLNVMVEITYVSNNNEDGDAWFTAYKICPGSCDDYWLVIRNDGCIFQINDYSVSYDLQSNTDMNKTVKQVICESLIRSIEQINNPEYEPAHY